MAQAPSKTPAPSGKVSVKRLQLGKTQSSILTVIVISVVVTIFMLFATKALVTKGLYQRRVLHARKDVVTQLKSNLDSANKLFAQYKIFAEKDPNVLGGSVNGTGNLDGDNARIVLDSLPSTYDAPALATSVEKVLLGRNILINSINVTDDPVTNSDQPQAEPTIKPVTFAFVGGSTYSGISDVLKDFERSIRPFDVNKLELGGTDNNLQLTVNMTTYFQPAKSLNLTPTKEVK